MDYLFKRYNLIIHGRWNLLIISISILSFYSSAQCLFSQQLNDNEGEFNIRNIREELYIRTDRNIYITGEQVWLKVYKLNSFNHAPWNISKVVYLELLDKNNFPLKQLKIKTDGNSGSSVLTLPENISSGNYLLRAQGQRI